MDSLQILINGLSPHFKNKMFLFHVLKDVSEEKAEKYIGSPYELVYESKLGFTQIDAYALSLNKDGKPIFKYDNIERLSAATYSILIMIEKGIENEDLREKTFLSDEEIESFDKMLLEDSGSSCLPEERLFKYIKLLLSIDEISDSQKYDILKFLILKKKVRTVTDTEGNNLILRRDRFEKESEIRSLIEQRSTESINNDALVFTTIEQSMAKTGLMLSREQKLAVKTSITTPLSIITGGPGTGKSSTLKVLLDSYTSLYPGNRIKLIAPTGQAAKRMREATGVPASTMHSALGIKPKCYKSTKILTEGLIVVDESSMVDEDLFLAFLQSTANSSKIVIVGDADQLPSIGVGNILSDLIDSCKIPVSRLTKIFRQKDNSIAFNAARMKVGNTLLEEDEKFRFIEAKTSKSIAKKAIDIYIDELNKDNDCIILTPFRKNTITGVNALNNSIREKIMDTNSTPHIQGRNDISYYLGDKIMYLVNKNGLVNGEKGKIVDISKDTVTCQFEGKTITLQNENLNEIIPAYAQTVHKSQGLEYATVIVICDPIHKKMLNRAILYTAITRCKENLYCIGKRAILDEAIKNAPRERYSGLKIMLKN